MGFFTILLYVLLAYMIINMFAQSKRAGKTNDLVALVKGIGEKDDFFKRADELIESTDNEVTKTKYKILRLWGRAYHHMYNEFEQEIDDIDPDVLMKDGSITDNEDSFFYLYITIPFLLQTNGEEELRARMHEKMAKYDEPLKDCMLVVVAMASRRFLDKEGDLGFATFNSIWEGDYTGMTYNKQLVGVYKNICAANMAWIYREQGDTARYEDLMEVLPDFANSGIGEKWLKALDLYDAFDKEVDEEDSAEDTGKEITDNIIDVEVEEHRDKE